MNGRKTLSGNAAADTTAARMNGEAKRTEQSTVDELCDRVVMADRTAAMISTTAAPTTNGPHLSNSSSPFVTSQKPTKHVTPIVADRSAGLF